MLALTLIIHKNINNQFLFDYFAIDSKFCNFSIFSSIVPI